ncbi:MULTISPECIES: PIN-like domain-containing protein [Bacillus subtilis group]|uniref:PIN-like domain-containing protein n=1 Tax=Bacillus subtilis group TaxID=653685 RepID=UPI000E70F87A|nr:MULTISPECIES: PIN domain-containing protein [Bacillus subtilis group]AYA42984.1 hypothetical protein DJ572_21365 [Bacillus subtilis]WIG48729.1 PIN domain-containing protein [Bacillus halotolerans]
MKSLFKEFYFDNKNTDIWMNSVIVLDTNILLNLYRYSKETSEKLLALLEKSKGRLWLPHQIALEFHLNRTNVILDQQTSYEKIESILRKKSSEIESSLKKELGSYRKKHVTLSIDSIIDQIKSSIDGLISEISQEKEDHPVLLKNDHIKQKITELFANKVGSPYKKEKLKEIEKEADKRYALEIPPGYRDASKKGAKFHNGEIILEKYGDYILWQQIIDFANKKQTDVIFITDDEKKDWWYESKGKTIGPRSELLNEFNYKTGMEFYMFKPEVFMKEAGDVYRESFSANTISEVKEVSKENGDYGSYRSHGEVIIPKMNTKEPYLSTMKHLNQFYFGDNLKVFEYIILLQHNWPFTDQLSKHIEDLIENIPFKEAFSIYKISSNKISSRSDNYDDYNFETKLVIKVYLDDTKGEYFKLKVVESLESELYNCKVTIIE